MTNRLNRLSFLIGPPRSGKSTFAKAWIRQGRPNEPPRVVLCGDHFRTALHGQTYQAAAEGFVFACIDVAAKAMFLGGYDVLIDETSSTEQTIKRYLRIDSRASPIFIDYTVAECLERARETNKGYLVGPILRKAIIDAKRGRAVAARSIATRRPIPEMSRPSAPSAVRTAFSTVSPGPIGFSLLLKMSLGASVASISASAPEAHTHASRPRALMNELA